MRLILVSFLYVTGSSYHEFVVFVVYLQIVGFVLAIIHFKLIHLSHRGLGSSRTGSSKCAK